MQVLLYGIVILCKYYYASITMQVLLCKYYYASITMQVLLYPLLDKPKSAMLYD